jgi:hypothetical protein
VVPRYRRALVTERHRIRDRQPGGAAIDWSLRSPGLGRQLAAVGVLALLAAGCASGRRVTSSCRRLLPLEHVRALAPRWPPRAATTSRPAHGGASATASALGAPVRATWILPGSTGWALPRTCAGQAALAELIDLTRRRIGTDGVLRAANAVETLWDER